MENSTAVPVEGAPESSPALATHSSGNLSTQALVLGALGVVYGDIGTSPLYALRECFHGPHAINVSQENVLGVLSLFCWALIVEVSLKYILWVMRADNRGEGGVLALMALAAHPQRHMRRSDPRRYLITLGLFGAALLYGDGIITPAISVLSAVEGLTVATPYFEPYVLRITIAILIGLFWVQYRGTAKLGTLFGPIILVWFLSIGLLGLIQIVSEPRVLLALNPLYGLSFLVENGMHAGVVLGSVFLCVTGGEALYADMGHFGRRPIKLGWFFVALPGLALNYLGQGALLFSDPSAAEHPFYKLAPDFLLYPLVALATAATVIASQALISGAFSLTRQAVQLGCLPRIPVLHTSSHEIGQIYVPLVNACLLLLTIVFVLAFRSSSAMAAAYGIAVSTTMVITTILTYFVSRELWGWGRQRALAVAGSFLFVDLLFFSANIAKIHQGGWVPIVIALFIFALMTTWRAGRRILAIRMRQKTYPFTRFIAEVKRRPPVRIPGTAIFMTGDVEGTPQALIHNLRHNKVLHETVVLLTVATQEVAHIADSERMTVERVDEGFYRAIIRYGFMEEPNVPEALSSGEKMPFDVSLPVYFLGRETILATTREGMAMWREELFAFMSRNAQRAALFYQIPSEQVIEIGLQVEL